MKLKTFKDNFNKNFSKVFESLYFRHVNDEKWACFFVKIKNIFAPVKTTL